jgi:hypothetical protein
VKNAFNILLSVYFTLVFTIGNAGVPFLIHTCTISQQSDIHFFQLEEGDTCFSSCSSEKSELFFAKESCCIVESGIVKSDIQTVQSEVVAISFDMAFVPVSPIFFERSFTQNNNQSYQSNAPPTASGQQIRILFQSFLC